LNTQAYRNDRARDDRIRQMVIDYGKDWSGGVNHKTALLDIVQQLVFHSFSTHCTGRGATHRDGSVACSDSLARSTSSSSVQSLKTG